MQTGVQNLGIIGGGQLARMLAMKCHELGIKAYVLSESEADPAAQVTRHWVQGDVNDLGTLKTFLEKVDVATFESEFLDPEKLALASQFAKKSLFPSVANMGLLQDRRRQKKLLDDAKIGVAPWIFVEEEYQAAEVLASIRSQMILKKCRFGYDGYGTFHVSSKQELRSIFEKPQPHGFIAEAKINFKRELAFMMARDQFGQTLSLPLVESFQKDSKCLWVKGPAKHAGFRKLETQIKNLLKRINYVGILGIELFDCGAELLVNELAPRVHNSGHYSMNALTHDQFLLHVMATSGMKIPKENTQLTKGFAMLNLIGGNWAPRTASRDLFYHWYGKSETRAGRKMGHLNSMGTSPEQALEKLFKAEKK